MSGLKEAKHKHFLCDSLPEAILQWSGFLRLGMVRPTWLWVLLCEVRVLPVTLGGGIPVAAKKASGQRITLTIPQKRVFETMANKPVAKGKPTSGMSRFP